MVQIVDNGAHITVRMKREHDMPKVICVKRREDDGTDTEIYYEPRSLSEALCRLLAEARAK